ACSPLMTNSPMWLTSKRPAAVRTAVCSLEMLEYSTGMDHPPKGISLAPILWWMSNKAVRFSVTVLFHGNIQSDLILTRPCAKLPLLARLRGIRSLPAISRRSPTLKSRRIEVTKVCAAGPCQLHSDTVGRTRGRRRFRPFWHWHDKAGSDVQAW